MPALHPCAAQRACRRDDAQVAGGQPGSACSRAGSGGQVRCRMCRCTRQQSLFSRLLPTVSPAGSLACLTTRFHYLIALALTLLPRPVWAAILEQRSAARAGAAPGCSLPACANPPCNLPPAKQRCKAQPSSQPSAGLHAAWQPCSAAQPSDSGTARPAPQDRPVVSHCCSTTGPSMQTADIPPPGCPAV